MSKYVWTKALPHKTSKEMIRAFQGMNKKDVPHFVAQNIVKANLAGRAIEMIKMRLARYATGQQKYR